eukprot:TRINITY_DN74999_c0_g1_i1.p1 TRINITY_DN74999_c0_g1~~TRINITY_DN74999_c0_g1_i1.p1  ORF type:complete len:586 (-),score=83.27 TRINITY_DN74999_c0_g1_i1:13-1770(-)
MKLFAVVWLRTLFADLVSSTKINAGAQARLMTSSNPCPGGATNRYPAALPSTFTFGESVGLSPLDAVWDTAALRAALAKDSEWTIGQPWLLSAKFTSDSTVDRTFAFSGGGSQGFLTITVPAGAQEQRIEAKGTVLGAASHTEFQYRAPSNFTSGAITMTDICLVPQTCDGYACPSSMKLKGASIFGRSDQRCCEFRKCQDEVACTPSTQYNAKSDFVTKIGYTKAHCCDAIFCPANLCENMTKWTDKGGSGVLGSTKEECCEPKECESYSCSDAKLWTKLSPKKANNSTRYGWSDEECCDPKYCSLYDCQPNITYVQKANASVTMGSTRDACCDIMNCSEFVCPDDTKWKKRGNETPGNTVDQCCEKVWCNAHRCSSADLQLKVSAGQRQGSTDDECCEQKFCKDYSCSDATKWQKRSDQYSSNNTDRRGFSDEECCDSKICLPEICDPATQWVPIKATNVQGSTLEQCCTPIYCSKYVCDTDLDGDGKGTQWLKRVDTNTFKWQGSTNEECCLPIYCSQYTTSNVTRWKRKADEGLKGSTDAECYDPRLCSDYCCIDDSKVLRANPEKHQGSTDSECCVPASR